MRRFPLSLAAALMISPPALASFDPYWTPGPQPVEHRCTALMLRPATGQKLCLSVRSMTVVLYVAEGRSVRPIRVRRAAFAEGAGTVWTHERWILRLDAGLRLDRDGRPTVVIERAWLGNQALELLPVVRSVCVTPERMTLGRGCR